MANTFSADLVVDRIAEGGLTKAQEVVPDFALFSTDFSSETVPVRPGVGAKSTIQVPLVTAGSTTLKNATNFESGDSTVAARPITINQLSQPFHITNAERQGGKKLDTVIGINLAYLLNAAWAEVKALMTVANFGAAILDIDPETVDTDDLKAIFAAGAKFAQRNLIVDPTFYAQFLPTDNNSFGLNQQGRYGFNNFSMASDWTGAGTNVNGFFASPAAIAIAARLPEVTSRVAEVVDQGVAVLPNGLSVQVNNWVSTSTRNEWMSFDILFGAGKGDETVGKIITDGT